MIYKIFAVYDSKSEAYTLPFYYHLENQALRTFSDWCNDPDHPFGKHPEDYTLFEIGVFDASQGSLEQPEKKSLRHALECVKSNEKS